MSSESIRIDSVTVREILRDTTIIVKRDSAAFRALLECDSLGRVTMRELLEYKSGGRVKPPSVTIVDNLLSAVAEVDSLKIFLQLKDRYTDKLSYEGAKTIDTIEVNRLTWWQSLWIRLGKALALVVIIFIFYKIFKPKITLLWKIIKQ